jgi:hypothetical protein
LPFPTSSKAFDLLDLWSGRHCFAVGDFPHVPPIPFGNSNVVAVVVVVVVAIAVAIIVVVAVVVVVVVAIAVAVIVVVARIVDADS